MFQRLKAGTKRVGVGGIQQMERVKCWKREWHWVHRQCGESREMIG